MAIILEKIKPCLQQSSRSFEDMGGFLLVNVNVENPKPSKPYFHKKNIPYSINETAYPVTINLQLRVNLLEEVDGVIISNITFLINKLRLTDSTFENQISKGFPIFKLKDQFDEFNVLDKMSKINYLLKNNSLYCLFSDDIYPDVYGQSVEYTDDLIVLLDFNKDIVGFHLCNLTEEELSLLKIYIK